MICHFNPLCSVFMFICHPSTNWTVTSPTGFLCLPPSCVYTDYVIVFADSVCGINVVLHETCFLGFFKPCIIFSAQLRFMPF